MSPKAQTRGRLSLRPTEQMREQLERIQKRTGAPTLTEVIRVALVEYELHLDRRGI